jgi:hypothetical protein
MTSEVSVRPADFCTFLRDAGPDIPILKEAKAESDSCPEKGSEISVRTLLSVAVPAGRGLTEIGVS